MSNYPGGPPPPHYMYPPAPQGPPPVPGAFTYVPTPVYMPVYQPPPPPTVTPVPMPQPNATYVTNIYQQPTPDPVVQLAEPEYDWVPATPTTANSFENRALVAGRDSNGSPLWVIRAHHNGECVPGKLAIRNRSAYIPQNGREVPVHNFEILVCSRPGVVKWVTSGYGKVPIGAIAAGNTHNAEPLYIARVRHRNSTTPGKVHPSHGCSYISYGGVELPHKNYEVLCKVD